MLKWVLGNKKIKAKRRKKPKRSPPSYDDARRIAESGDVEARLDLASHEELEPELLYYFATDESPDVRCTVAENTGTPLQADAILAKDENEEVRSELALKICRLIPNLSKDESDRLTTMAMEILDVLARDELPRVRTIISEELKQADNVPPNIVMRLAKDVEEIVAAPILEYSPLLSDEDLIEIISSGIGENALHALSKRRELVEPVVDAIVEIRNVASLQALLGNKSAQIREETLDAIAIIAVGAVDLHKPMVNRDNLPLKIIRRIASFVSASLVEILVERNELDPDMVGELRMAVRKRIDKEDDFSGDPLIPSKAGKPVAPDEDGAPMVSAKERAEQLFAKGELNDVVICQALDGKDQSFVRHSLVLMSGLAAPVAAKMLNTGSGKGVTTLAWKAGLNMDTAVQLQLKLAKIKPKGLVEPLEDGGCPMSEEDLEWYVEYYSA